VSPRGIRVNRVARGFTETEAAARLIERLAAQAGSDTAVARQNLMNSLGGSPQPARRRGKPEANSSATYKENPTSSSNGASRAASARPWLRGYSESGPQDSTNSAPPLDTKSGEKFGDRADSEERRFRFHPSVCPQFGKPVALSEIEPPVRHHGAGGSGDMQGLQLGGITPSTNASISAGPGNHVLRLFPSRLRQRKPPRGRVR